MSQKDVFLQSEGDAWFERNRLSRIDDASTEPVLKSLTALGIKPKRVLEIGCSSGNRLATIANALDAECHGVDPSAKAIEYGRGQYPNLSLRQGTADELLFGPTYFDVVIFGFCLYLCDPTDYFKIAWQADRVLADKGFLIIKDFFSAQPYRNSYSHTVTLYSHKMEFSKMFRWHPAYTLLSRSYLEHREPMTFDQNERISIDLMRKDGSAGFPSNGSSNNVPVNVER
jgi:ubiquinone/menaquinone biosynthesis C-methylase UbiE